MVTNSQLALVHVGKKQLHLDDETYRDILHVQGGVRSAKDLSPEGLDKVLARFAELGFAGRPDGNRKAPRSRRQPAVPEDVTGQLPTPGQQGMLAHLWQDLGWTGSRRIEFSKRVVGRAWPQTRGEASKLIEALKSMRDRGYDQRVPRRRRRVG